MHIEQCIVIMHLCIYNVSGKLKTNQHITLTYVVHVMNIWKSDTFLIHLYVTLYVTIYILICIVHTYMRAICKCIT